MSLLVDRDRGPEMVRRVVADCLARQPEDIPPHSRLINDLGADSLDFIDLIFTLEKNFGVKIREDDFNAFLRPSSGNRDSANMEFLPVEAVNRLLPWLPELALVGDRASIRPAQVWPLITVEALWRLVEWKASAPVAK